MANTQLYLLASRDLVAYAILKLKPIMFTFRAYITNQSTFRAVRQKCKRIRCRIQRRLHTINKIACWAKSRDYGLLRPCLKSTLVNRPPDKSVCLKNSFLISQPKHMF